MACWAMMQSSSLRCSASVSSCVHGEIASNTRLSCVASFGRPLKFVALKSRGHKNRKEFPPRVVTATLGLEESSDGVTAATIDCNVVEEAILGQQGQSMEVDTVTEAELKENGFRSTRRTNLICTIDPATCAPEQLEALAMGGMNVARLNMCHGTREWRTQVICNVRSLNSEKGYSVAIMMDTKGSEIHVGDFNGAPSVKAKDGEEWIFTVCKLETLLDYTAIVNYDGFAEDVRVGDELVVDGGMVQFEVKEKVGLDVKCKCIDPGLLLPRANLTFWLPRANLTFWREGPLVREQGVKKGVRLQAYFDPGCNEARHAPPVKSFTMSDGTCIDCIPIEGQIAAHHPSLQDHVIQMPPSRGPWRPSESHPQAFAREHGGCPEGTIPVLRDDPMGKFMQKVAPPWKAPVPVGSENPALGADTAKHEYAVTSIPRVPCSYSGTKSTFSVNCPILDSSSEMSLSQFWIVDGSYDDNSLSTIEVGWQTQPLLHPNNNPNAPHLFIFWTNDAYAGINGGSHYNLLCPGFVQYNNSWVIGGAMPFWTTLAQNAPFTFEVTIAVLYYPSDSDGNWWLYVDNEAIGYWPSSIFRNGYMQGTCNHVQWGGEVAFRVQAGQTKY